MEMQELQARLEKRAALEAEHDAWLQKCTELEQRSLREKQNLEYERSDVEALEGKTLKAFLYTALGKKEERLEQEEREADEAKQQYEATLGELADAQKQVRRIEAELRALKKAEQDYQKLVKAQAERLKEIEPLLSDADALSLETMQKQLDEQKKNQESLSQSIEEGRKLMRCVENVMESLQSALDNASYDHLEVAKYEELAEAQKRFELLKIQQKRFLEVSLISVELPTDFQIYKGGESDRDLILNAVCSESVAFGDPYLTRRVNQVDRVRLHLDPVLCKLEKRLERSKQLQLRLETSLSELLGKYQA